MEPGPWRRSRRLAVDGPTCVDADTRWVDGQRCVDRPGSSVDRLVCIDGGLTDAAHGTRVSAKASRKLHPPHTRGTHEIPVTLYGPTPPMTRLPA